MTITRDFDLSDILSVTPGALVSSRHIEGVYDILNFMTGDDLHTHVLPRAAEACAPALIEQHPQLADIVAPEFSGTSVERRSLVECWVLEMKGIHGDTLTVTPLTEWHRMDPVQELAELTETPQRIVVVEDVASTG